MLLALDCGNTHIVLGIYQDDQLLCHFRLASDAKRTEDEYMALLYGLLHSKELDLADIKAMIIGSVVPDLEFILFKMAEKYFNLIPILVNDQTDTGINIKLTNPGEMGADRLINAVAAHHFYQGDLIIIDFGTATTYDYVTTGGDYLGGAITPGIEISRRALFDRAARLAHIPMQYPPHAVGRNTAESVQSGTLWGFGGQVDNIVAKMREEMGSNPLIIATGGLASFIAPYTKEINEVNNLLTLEGLRLIYQRMIKDE